MKQNKNQKIPSTLGVWIGCLAFTDRGSKLLRTCVYIKHLSLQSPSYIVKLGRATPIQAHTDKHLWNGSHILAMESLPLLWSSCTASKISPGNEMMLRVLPWGRKIKCLWRNPCAMGDPMTN